MAASRCRDLGMQLISFETEEKWLRIREVLLETGKDNFVIFLSQYPHGGVQ